MYACGMQSVFLCDQSFHFSRFILLAAAFSITPKVGHDNWVRQVVVHPTGEHIISCSDDRSIRTWNVLTGEMPGLLFSVSNFSPSQPCFTEENKRYPTTVDVILSLQRTFSGHVS